MRNIFLAGFPNGFRRIPNAAPMLRCGIYALRDSIAAQIGPAAVPLPSINDLQAIMDGCK